jgi:hypothetical protein
MSPTDPTTPAAAEPGPAPAGPQPAAAANPGAEPAAPQPAASAASGNVLNGRAVDSAGNGISGLEILVEFSAPHHGRLAPPLCLPTVGEEKEAGAFQLTREQVPKEATSACLTFPKRHTLGDHRVVVLKGAEMVEVPLRGSYTLRDRVYETVGCAIHGTVCREVVRDGRVRHEPFAHVPVELFDSEGTSRGRTTTCADGSFCFSPDVTKPQEFTLRFPARQPAGADTWGTKHKEVSLVAYPGYAASPCEAVCYSLDAAEVTGLVLGDGGLGGVHVTLVQEATGARTTCETNHDGEYHFRKVVPSRVRLLFECRHSDKANVTWEVPAGQGEQAFSVRAGQQYRVDPVQYQREQHAIEWFVRSADGQGLSGYLVELRTLDGKRVVGQKYSEPATGRAVFSDLTPGGYKVLVYADERTAVPPLEEEVICNSVVTGGTVITARPPLAGGVRNVAAGGGGNGNGEIRESVADLAAYPVLTEQVNVTGAGGAATPTGTPTGTGGGSLSRLITGTLRDVLGWKPRADDTRGFVAALNQSFAGTEVEGRTEYAWVPRSSGALARPADLGAVTGAQLSIYTRARAALDQAFPLLDGLYPLRPDILAEDIDAIRAVVHTELGQLVDELGTVGGPRVARVDELFDLLLGNASDPQRDTDPEHVQGQLKELRDRLGLERTRVNTIADEQDFTNFLILVDYVNTLNQSWRTERRYFTRGAGGGEPFLGTQLVLMAQGLAAAAEAVQDVTFTLESVFLGQPMQQTLSLSFDGPLNSVPPVPGDDPPEPLTGTPPMFVSELLGWADVWLTREARELIDSSGKDGVIALFPTANRLRKLVRAALVKSRGGLQDPAGLPVGYASPRVQRAIQELATQLDEIASRAGEIVSQEEGPRGDVTAQTLVEASRTPTYSTRCARP